MHVIKVSGTGNLTIPGAPKIVVQPYETKISSLPGLMFCIDPATIKSDLTGKDRVGGMPLSSALLGALMAANPNMNNRTTLNVASGGRLVMAAGAQRGTQTIVAAIRPLELATGKNALHDTPCNIVFTGVSIRGVTNTGAGDNILTTTNTVGQMVFLAVSVDEATKTSSIVKMTLANNNVEESVKVHTTMVANPLAQALTLGRQASGAAGEFGLVLGFNKALHLTEHRVELMQALNTLREYYAS